MSPAQLRQYGIRDVEKLLRIPRSTLRALVAAGFVKPARAELLLVDTDVEVLLDRIGAWTPPALPRIWLTPAEA